MTVATIFSSRHRSQVRSSIVDLVAVDMVDDQMPWLAPHQPAMHADESPAADLGAGIPVFAVLKPGEP